MGLERYRRKRDFRVTPEPRGSRVRKRGADKLSFLVQKHAATRLHYDFRLELDGVLLSWAVPKGPSLDPRHKRLAVHVEDHPLEYGDFEGVIPEKQYGGGTVLLWDRGTWHPAGDARASYDRGRLEFTLEGEKLRGSWNLVRTHRRDRDDEGKSWLLIKEDDEHARSAARQSVTDAHPDSVASGRSLDEIAQDADRVWQSNRSVAENVRATGRPARRSRPRPKIARLAGATRSELPARLDPQLATLVKAPVDGDGWLHEIKHDGYRMLARLENGVVRMMSRTGRDWTGKFPRVERALARLPLTSAWLDGEVVVLDHAGRSSFQALQNAIASGEDGAFVYFVFDAPHVDGFDLRRVQLVERKSVLQQLVAGATASSPVRYSAHVACLGREFLAQACELQLEGAVSKRADAPYEAGRGRSWLKVKCSKRQEMVIGGYTEADGARNGFGALHLGVYERDGGLRYAGKVGTGFTQASLASLFARLQPLAIERPPFRNPPTGAEARRSRWVRPELVCEVTFTEWTDDGTLRHPSFQGLREDRAARDVVREVAQAAGAPPAAPARLPAAQPKKGDAVVRGIVITNPDKELYPEAGLSKLDLARFYEAIGEHLLPHLRNRPLTIVRCPNGWQGHCFYQKSARGTHPALDRVKVHTSDGPADYLMASSVAAIVATLQLGALELHPWGATADELDFADRLTFDLDPADDVGWPAIVEAATLVRTLLEKIGLQGFLKTTGGKGLHVVLPVEPTLRWEAAKGFSKAVADLLCQTFPDRFTPSISRASRRGRIFIDYLRNAEGSTAVAAYSLRARANAPVPTPISWSELRRDVRFDHFNAKNLLRRLARRKHDPWASFFSLRQAITADMMQQVGYAAGGASPAEQRRRWRRR